MPAGPPPPPVDDRSADGIVRLPERIAALAPDARGRVERVFEVDRVVGRTDPPAEMEPWLTHHFGAVQAVREQTVVRARNRWSQEGTLFSPLRGLRPLSHGDDLLAHEIAETQGDAFCSAEESTPADTWGRVRGRYAVTAANLAKYDGQHGVVILDRHDPLAFDEARIEDLLAVGHEWADRAHEADPSAHNYLLIWNCGRRAGGSIVHGHAQVLLGRGAHYARVERLRRDAKAFREATGLSYLGELVAAHRELGLGLSLPGSGEVTILASLTPVKERELLIVGPPGMDERHPAFAIAVARTLVAYRDGLGVRAFNLALVRPPLGPQIAGRDGWQELGPMIHVVDRGDPALHSSDIGAMELFASSVVTGDPFVTMMALRTALDAGRA